MAHYNGSYQQGSLVTTKLALALLDNTVLQQDLSFAVPILHA